MIKKPLIAGFNHEWVKTVTRDEFITAQSHLADADRLGEEYDKIVPPISKKDAKEVKEEKK